MKKKQDSPNTATFIIEGDGKELYSHDFAPGDFPEDVLVDVKGVNKLTLKITVKEEIKNEDMYIGVFNPTLTVK
jgi:hypothetical protein